MLSLLLFLHVTAVCGLFAGVVLELVALGRLHGATTYAQARTALCNGALTGKIMGPCGLTVIATGIGMVYTARLPWTSWIVFPLALAVIMMISGPAIAGRGMASLGKACANGEGDLEIAIDAARRGPALNFTVFFSLFAIVALLYIMTTKPETLMCEIAVIVAVAAAALCTAAVRSKAKEPAPVQA